MPSSTSSVLLSPLKMGGFDLAHRIVLPSMLRHLAGPVHGVPSELMTSWYAQCATPGGLIVTETSWVHAHGHTDGREPGLYSPEQVNAWRGVTTAIHARGGIALAQLGFPSTAATTVDAPLTWLTTLDIDATLRHARDAAECAGDAGFDGVELLATLPELFFHAQGIQGHDEYGGSVQNRIRLLLDLVHTLAGVWPMDRIGLRLSAITPDTASRHAGAIETLHTAVSAAFNAGVAYVHIGLPCTSGHATPASVLPDTLSALHAAGRPGDGGVIVASGGFTIDRAQQAIEAGWADAIGFGRAFIATPNLPVRLRQGL